MSRRRRRPPAPRPVFLEPPVLPFPSPAPSREPESVSKLGFCEFMRIFNSVADVLDPHYKTGHLYTPDEIARKIRAMEILKSELDRIIGNRDSVTFQTIESANRICGNVLRFDARRTPARKR